MHNQAYTSTTLRNKTKSNGGIKNDSTTTLSGGATLSSCTSGNRDIDCSDILNDEEDDDDHQSCFCFESDDDSAERIKIKNTKRKIARSCVGNIVISVLLIVYTLIGSIIFLLIEGGITDLSYYNSKNYRNYDFNFLNNHHSNNTKGSSTTNFSTLGEESRTKTVENIWDITVNLNILYRENWTRLAGQEMIRFQEQLVQRVLQEMNSPMSTSNDIFPSSESAESPPSLLSQRRDNSSTFNEKKQKKKNRRRHKEDPKIDWNLAKSFLYSLTLLTTIGFGNIGPKTSFGKIVTMIYCIIGIPLMLIYLTSMGSMLSNCARGVFTRSLCCCLCSNCGYCCYDEQRMAEKEKRMKRKRELREQQRLAFLKQKQDQKTKYQNQNQNDQQQYEPFYVTSSTSTFTNLTNNSNNSNSSTSQIMTTIDNIKAIDRQPSSIECLSNTNSFNDINNQLDNTLLQPSTAPHNENDLLSTDRANCIAPILFCIIVMIIYISFGTVVLHRLEKMINSNSNVTFIDSLFFCFMSLTTIGFYGNDNIPIKFLTNSNVRYENINLTTSSNMDFKNNYNSSIKSNQNLTLWFCSAYIVIGMPLTAMCFHIFYDEIIIRFKYNLYCNHDRNNFYKRKSITRKIKSDKTLSSDSTNSKNNNDNSRTNTLTTTNTNSILLVNSMLNSNSLLNSHSNLNFLETTATNDTNITGGDNNVVLNPVNNSSTSFEIYQSSLSNTMTSSVVALS